MIDRLLKSHLEPVARSSQRWQLWRALAACWAVLALAGLVALRVQHNSGWSSPFTFFALLAGAVVAAVLVARHFRTRPLDYQAIARQIEQENPELHALLLTAVEQEPLSAGGQLNYLQQRVVLEALDHHRRSAWAAGMSRRNSAALGAHWLTLALLVASLVALRPHFSISLPGGLWAGAEHSNGVTVTPGDASLERGTSLVVLAKFDGRLPAQAELVITPANEPEQRILLTKNLDDPVFGGGIPELKSDLKYHIEFPAGRTRDFKVSVFEYPKLDHADAKITYPAYTGVAEKTIKNTRRVSALEGSTLEYSFFLNKPVASAKWVAKDQTAVALSGDSNNATVYHTKMTLNESHRYELVLVDDAGRTNKMPPEFVLEALKNKSPTLTLTSPRGDQTVSPLEEIAFTGDASDDYGLKSYGIAYTLGGGETKTVELGQGSKPNEKKTFNYVLPLESLGAQPDELLSYYAWADDTGPDGQTRRMTSDIYFAEIKPFDQVFREAQQAEAGGNQNNQNQGGQRGGQGNQPDSLADLEKQIVTATFNLQRREKSAKPSDKFKDDVTVVHNSQDDALDQLQTLKEQNEDPKRATFIDAAEKAMKQAVSQLGNAADKNSLAPLPPALTAEQAAYQAVLKLSAREFQVARGQRGQRGQQSQRSQRAQRQLQQLDLAQNQNRYETQRQAQDNQRQNPQQQQQLQVANRLKELAQRQQDLNQRVRELQASLQEARTEQERADIRERLKRLTEEQQNVLADVDELRQRLDQQDNQSPDQSPDGQQQADQSQDGQQSQSQAQAQQAAQRQQLDQTRSEVQNAAEQLAQNNPAQALASGTRAQQDLQQLQDQVRKQNSAQFTEEMRQMRNDARQLAQNEDDINKKLTELADPSQRKLSETDEQRKDRTDLSTRLSEQKAGVTNLLDQMRQVSEKSETAEPLLSQQLYDTIRQTQQDELSSALDSSSELVRRGFVQQASPYENRARQNIDQLKDGVDRAAESVLGDGTDALREAQRELQQLTDEIAQAEAQAASARGTNGAPRQLASNQRGTNRSGRNGQPGQRGDAQNQPGQNGDQTGNGENPNADPQSGQDGQGQPSANGQRQGNQPGRNGRNGRNGQGQPGQRGDGQPQPGQPGDQPGSGDAQSADQQNPPDGQGQGLANGQRPGNQPGRNGGNGRNGRNGRNGQGQPGQPGDGQNQPDPNGDQQANVGENPNPDQQNTACGPGGNRNGRAGGGPRNGGANYGGGPGGSPNWGGDYAGPIVDTNYVAWTDRLRNVEEMVTDVPELATQVAQIRDRARALRLAYNRDGKKPDWAVVTTQISTPLAEVRARVDEELLKRTSKDALVPLDRDPVPAQYSERVKRYYEELGKSD